MNRRHFLTIIHVILVGCCISVYPMPARADVTGATWTNMKTYEPWPSRYGHTTVVFHGNLWVIGGYEYDSRRESRDLNDVWRSTDGLNWIQTTGNAPWTPRSFHCSVVFKDKIWVIGGYDHYVTNPTDVWCSSDGVEWTQTISTVPWGPNNFPTAAVFNDSIWASCEHLGEHAVWYSDDGITWTENELPFPGPPRVGHSATVFDSKLWIMGGSTSLVPYDYDFVHALNDIWYTADGPTWTEALPSAPWQAREGHATAVLDNNFWLFGGDYTVGKERDGYTCFLNDVWYSPDGINWTEQTANAPWAARTYHTAAAFHGKVWVLGGAQSWFLGSLNDIWCLSENIPDLTVVPETDFRFKGSPGGPFEPGYAMCLLQNLGGAPLR